jgi:long-chain acyl-CoA synthetase
MVDRQQVPALRRHADRAPAAEQPARAEPRPWLKNYPEGVRWDTEFPVRSLPEMFDEAVAIHGERELTNFLGATMTYAEMGDLANRVAAGLQARGIGRGKRVGLFLPNTPYYIAAYFAILKTGATVVNFNPLYSVEELMGQARGFGYLRHGHAGPCSALRQGGRGRRRWA